MGNNNYNKIFADMLEGLDLTLVKDDNGGYILYDYIKDTALMYGTFSDTCYEPKDFDEFGKAIPHDISDYTGKTGVTAKELYEAIPDTYTYDRYWSIEGMQFEFCSRFPDAEWTTELNEYSMEAWLEFAKNPTEQEVKLSFDIPFAECGMIKEFDLICNHLDEVDVESVYKLMHSGYEMDKSEERVRTPEKSAEDKEKPKKKSSHDYER